MLIQNTIELRSRLDFLEKDTTSDSIKLLAKSLYNSIAYIYYYYTLYIYKRAR